MKCQDCAKDVEHSEYGLCFYCLEAKVEAMREELIQYECYFYEAIMKTRMGWC